MKNYIFVFILCISISHVFANDNLSAYLNYNSGLSGSTTDKKDPDLQIHGGVYEKSLEAQYEFSSMPIIFGFGIATLEKNYILFLNGIGPSLDYKLKHDYIYTRFGYKARFNSFSIKPSLSIGSGNYTFKGDQSINESGSALIYGIDLNFEGNINNSRFLWLAGFGYLNGSYSAVDENNIDVENEEMNGELSLNLGLGWSF